MMFFRDTLHSLAIFLNVRNEHLFPAFILESDAGCKPKCSANALWVMRLVEQYVSTAEESNCEL